MSMLATTWLAVLLAATPCKAYRMVALDMDGTLLNAAHALSPASKSVLRELSAAGVTVSLCSGRSHVAMAEVIQQLDLPELPAVCFNGARGMSYARGEAPRQLFVQPLGDEAADAVLGLAAKQGVLAQYYVGDDVRRPHWPVQTQPKP
jgi:hydroxymethylpyrimidine pyrophosphatase-like HAD family hydrolase